MRRIPLVLSLLLIWTGLNAARAADVKVALVIGNADYLNAEKLLNPVRDAEAIAAALVRLQQFRSVDILRNASKASIDRALGDFAEKAKSADIAVIYYSGHGVSVNNTNYVVPIDARLASEDRVPFEAVSLDLIVQAANTAKKFKLILLDACRNNPFSAKWRRGKGGGKKGLARPDVSADDIIVGFATKEGEEADDGAGTLSPYATALVRHLPSRVDVREMLRRVGQDVRQSTGGQQRPTSTVGSDDQIYIAGPPTDPEAAPVRPGVSQDELEIEAWKSLGPNPTIQELEAFLRAFPNGKYAGIARAKLEKLREAERKAGRNGTAPPSAPPSTGPIQPSPGAGPSFDCKEDRQPDDQVICADPELSRKDRLLASLYTQLKNMLWGSERDALVASQREWLKRRRTCYTPTMSVCISRMYDDRIAEIQRRLSVGR